MRRVRIFVPALVLVHRRELALGGDDRSSLQFDKVTSAVPHLADDALAERRDVDLIAGGECHMRDSSREPPPAAARRRRASRPRLNHTSTPRARLSFWTAIHKLVT